jgi:hypothetical protein
MEHEWRQSVRRADLEGMSRLLVEGQNIDARDEYGQTALMIAAHEGRAEVVAFLVEQGALLDHTAKYGLSALMLAVMSGHIRVVQILVNAGADMTLRGRGAPGFAGKMALDLAVAQGRRDIADVLAGLP